MRHVQAELHAAIDELLMQEDLSTPQLEILSTLWSRPGMCNADLARAMFVTPQTVIPLLSSLEKKKLITRSPAPEGGRSMPATLTQSGKEKLKAGWLIARKIEVRMLIGLSEAEGLRLRELLEHCLEQLRPMNSVHRKE
jgi:DNA-binding MarR family transcriptional regulator